MRHCIAFMFQDEEPWLYCLAGILEEAEYPVIAVDGGSQDNGAGVLRNMGADVFERPFDWDFAAQQNALIDRAIANGYETMLLLAPDELMHVADIHAGFHLLREYKAVVVPRINFEEDRTMYCPWFYPDWQTRFWVLDDRIRWRGKHHSSILGSMQEDAKWIHQADTREGARHDIVNAPHLPIFHYEGIKPLARRKLKQLNYHRSTQGLPPLSGLPEGTPLGAHRHRIPYTGLQPLDPHIIGRRYPYNNE